MFELALICLAQLSYFSAKTDRIGIHVRDKISSIKLFTINHIADDTMQRV